MAAWNGKNIFGQTPNFVVESDASLWGGGGLFCQILHGQVVFFAYKLLKTNNRLLLWSCSFTRDGCDCCILLRMDNVSAVQYINKLGGTRSESLSSLTRDLYIFCLKCGISLRAEYMPGLQNQTGD